MLSRSTFFSVSRLSASGRSAAGLSLRVSFLATILCALAISSSPLIQRSAAQSAATGLSRPRISETIRGGVVTSGVGLRSTLTEEASFALPVQLPPGSTIRKAWLFSSVYNFGGGPIPTPASGEHRMVRLGQGDSAQTRILEGNGDSQTRERDRSFGGRPSYHLFATDVTESVRGVWSAQTNSSGAFEIPIAERGDDAQATNIFIGGHGLVVEYEHPAAPLRIVIVSDAATSVPQGQTAPLSFILRLPARVSNHCGGQPGFDPAVLSLGIALDLADCDESNELRVNSEIMGSRLGGPDDMRPAATGTCFETGGEGHEGLYTIGNLGADARTTPVGVAGDSLTTTGGRIDDELYEITRLVQDGADSLAIRLFKNSRRAGDVTDIPVLVFQARAQATNNDSDGDGVNDATEGDCARTDSDRDGIPDYLDADSDNDCALDSAPSEAGAARLQVASNPSANCNDGKECTRDACNAGVCSNPPRNAGERCSTGVCTGDEEAMCVQCLADNNCSGGTPFCNTATHQCQECLQDGQCNDRNDCTSDACREGVCIETSLAVATACPNGVCNGAAQAPMCVQCVSDAQCSGNTPRCDVRTNRCAACLTDAQCSDGNACTQDVCSAGGCQNPPLAPGSACNGGVCNGASERAACVQCVSDAQCSGRNAHCNVQQNRCFECTSDSNCDDGNPCTQDSCGNGTCAHRPTEAGATCPTGYCNGRSQCWACINDAQCDDGVECTNDRCSQGTCAHTNKPRGSTCASGVCDPSGPSPMCVTCVSDAQCGGATPRCNTATHQCQACLNDGQCNDQNACTTDSCQNGSCRNQAVNSGASCGRGVCDSAQSPPMCVACLSDAQCSGRTNHCNSSAHQCQECVNDGHCDDGNPCTQDSCGTNGSCSHRATELGATCPNGYCNGRSQCWACVNDSQCNDGNACTQDQCRGGTCTTRPFSRGSACPSGVCNGAAQAPVCVSCVSNAQCGGDTACCDAGTNQCIACPVRATPAQPARTRARRPRR